MTTKYQILLVAALALSTATVAHADIYKWKDAQGVTHYGDTMPPQAAGRATTEMSKRGTVLKQTPAALTPEQRLNNEAEAAKITKEQQSQTEQKRHDSALLNTYTSPAEIDLARDRSLEQSKLVVDGTNLRLAPLRDKQAKLIKQSGGKIPGTGPQAAEYAANLKHITELEDILSQKSKEMADIRSKFDADKTRFIELTGKTASPK
ncbi:DUF4124 domain-containing protein [Sulfuriferula thiophila]|uniref:DUF4124 domain-containing protein n=1 Tax=Sulfuriferula thiophila TaxID=1781211 RepID=UPI000F606981|nr:DUF4124 domain-containing protein [Sulfuriferula thiophila]